MTLDHHDPNRCCIFRCQEDAFAIPAACVHQVAVQPKIATVPMVDPAMAGLAYIHKEFLPVFDLRALISSTPCQLSEDQQMLSLSINDCMFGLLVAHVVGLDELEITYAEARAASDEWLKVISGTAKYNELFLSVIKPEALLDFVIGRLQGVWSQLDKPQAQANLIELGTADNRQVCTS